MAGAVIGVRGGIGGGAERDIVKVVQKSQTLMTVLY